MISRDICHVKGNVYYFMILFKQVSEKIRFSFQAISKTLLDININICFFATTHILSTFNVFHATIHILSAFRYGSLLLVYCTRTITAEKQIFTKKYDPLVKSESCSMNFKGMPRSRRK